MHTIVAFCIRMQISPNTITAFSIAPMLIGWWFITKEIYEAAIVFLLVSMLLDMVDGAVARTMEEAEKGSGITKFGELLDPLKDKVLFVGSLFVINWTPLYMRIGGTTLELLLLGIRFFKVIGSNGYGKTKTVFENTLIIALLLQKCRPEYIPIISFVVAMVFGSMSFITHARGALNYKPSEP